MNRNFSKKAATLLLVGAFYLVTSFLGTLCTSGSKTGHHHQKRGVQHSLSCLMACSNMVAKEWAAGLFHSSLPFYGALLLSLAFLKPLLRGTILRSRAPPALI